MMGVVKKIESYLLKKINIDRYLPLQLDITNLCNLRCVHCYHPHHKNEGAISLSDWQEIIVQYRDLIRKMHFRPSVVFCGGEPLTGPYLIPLLQFAKEKLGNPEFSILTNGTLITKPLLAKLEQFDNLHFQVSIDGPDSDRHDEIRGKGNFEKAIAGIRLLKESKFSVSVLSVLSKKTSFWMVDFFQLAKKENFDSMNFTRFIPEGHGRTLVDHQNDAPLLGFELKLAYEKLLRLMLQYQVKSRTQGPLFELLIPGLGRSGRFWESIIVDYQGFLIASSRAKLRLGHALRDGLENVFTKNEIYKSLRTGKVEGCGQCQLYAVCGGDRNAAYATSGNFLGKDPGCWKDEFQEINIKGRAL